MRVLIAASGGGHTGYAVALAQFLVEFGVEPDFVVPVGDVWSRSKVERYGRVVAETSKFMGPETPLWKGVLRAPWEFFRVLKRVPGGYDVVVSTGSNHSVLVALASRFKGAEIINIEASVRFTRPSRAVRVLRRFARLTVLQWSEQKRLVPEGVVLGPFYEKPEYESYDGGYILVSCGTYGYKQLFDILVKLSSYDNIVLQTGRVDPQPYIRARPEWKVFRFDPDLGRWIAGAKLVITHLGKTALDAALTYRKPLVIVPNPQWTRHGAGLEDARMLARKLNAVLVEPWELSVERLEEAIEEAMKRKPPIYPNGAKKLAEMLVKELL